MNDRRNIVWVSIMFVLAVFSAVAPGAGSTRCLSVRAEPHKNSIIVGEPLIVKVMVRNRCDDTIGLSVLNQTSYQHKYSVAKILLSDDGVSFQNWRHGMRSGVAINSEPLRLERGGRHVLRKVILYNQRMGFAFPEPGSRFIRTKIIRHAEQEYFTSNVSEVEVVEPRNENDVKAWEALKQHARAYGTLIQVPRYVSNRYALSRSGRAALVQLFRKYPDSVYAPYIALSLGQHDKARMISIWKERMLLASRDESGESRRMKKRAARLRGEAIHYLQMVPKLTRNRTLKQLARREIKGIKRLILSGTDDHVPGALRAVHDW